MKPLQKCSLLIGTFLSLFSSQALANVGDAFGFGSRTGSLAGAGVAWGFDGFAAYDNPAGLALESPQRLQFSYALLDMVPSFLPISNVVIENGFTSDKDTNPTHGDVDVSYKPTLGQAIGLSYQLLPHWHRLSLGITSFLPLDQLAYIDSGETFIPEYVLYRSRTQRLQFELGLGSEILSKFYLGFGIHIGNALTSKAVLFLQANPTKTSSMRFIGSLKPKASPYLGLLYNPTPSFSFGSVLRFPLASPGNLSLQAGARTFGSLVALDFTFSSMAAIYYDPLSWETGISWEYFRGARVYFQLDYQAWSRFQLPSISIESPQTTSCTDTSPCGINISGSINPSYTLQNIIIPRFGHEWTLGQTTLRFGVGYRPSIFKNLPIGPGNYLDPPKYFYSAGVGLAFEHFLSFNTPSHLDFHFSYQKLITQNLVKDSANQIGAPGYQAGGKILGGGISLSLAF